MSKIKEGVFKTIDRRLHLTCKQPHFSLDTLKDQVKAFFPFSAKWLMHHVTVNTWAHLLTFILSAKPIGVSVIKWRILGLITAIMRTLHITRYTFSQRHGLTQVSSTVSVYYYYSVFGPIVQGNLITFCIFCFFVASSPYTSSWSTSGASHLHCAHVTTAFTSDWSGCLYTCWLSRDAFPKCRSAKEQPCAFPNLFLAIH